MLKNGPAIAGDSPAATTRQMPRRACLAGRRRALAASVAVAVAAGVLTTATLAQSPAPPTAPSAARPAAPAALPASPGPATGAWPAREFCGRAQSYIAGSGIRVTNTVHDGPESFQRTAPAAQPLTTQQLDWPDDGGAPGALRSISCKFVTADRIRAAHGPAAARSQASCEQVNRYTLRQVLDGLSEDERRRALFDRGRKVRIERDRPAASAEAWHAPNELASVDARGRLRIVADSWRADWSDARQAQQSDETRGVHFCHLVAPDYLRRLLLDPSIILPGPAPRSPR